MSAIKVDLLIRAIIEETKSYMVHTAQYAKNVEDRDAKIAKLDESIASKERHIIQLEDIKVKEKTLYKTSLNLMELDLLDARRLLANETCHNQERSNAISTASAAMREAEREVRKREAHLDKCKRLKNIFSKMASLMHQEQFFQSLVNGSERSPELNVAEELMDLYKNLSKQNLTSFVAADRGREETRGKEEHPHDDWEVTKLQDVIKKAEWRLSEYKRLVDFTKSMHVGEEDAEWDALSRKVTHVFESCIGETHGRNCTAMLGEIEYHISLLLDQLDRFPHEKVKSLRKLVHTSSVQTKTEEQLKGQRTKEEETLPDEDALSDSDEGPPTPEHVCWDEEAEEKEEESAVAGLWEDWSLGGEVKLANQGKKKKQKEKKREKKGPAAPQTTRPGPRSATATLRIPPTNARQPPSRRLRPILPKVKPSNFEETSIIQPQQSSPVTATPTELDKLAKANKQNLATLLRMRRLY